MEFKIKTIVIGDYSSGKTSILKRLNDEAFNNMYTSTIGVDYFKKKYDHDEIFMDTIILEDDTCQYSITSEKTLKNFAPKNSVFKKYHQAYKRHDLTKEIQYNLSIWDTSGQEKFSFLTSTYYRNISSALVVFDITNYDSFKAAETWIKDLFEKINDESKAYFPIVIVGNKFDLRKDRAVSYDEASKFAGKMGYRYVECSAKDDYKIHDIFKELISEIVFRVNHELILPSEANGLQIELNYKNLFPSKDKSIMACEDDVPKVKCCEIM